MEMDKEKLEKLEAVRHLKWLQTSIARHVRVHLGDAALSTAPGDGAYVGDDAWRLLKEIDAVTWEALAVGEKYAALCEDIIRTVGGPDAALGASNATAYEYPWDGRMGVLPGRE